MRFTVLSLAAFIAVVSAQGESNIPACARTCIGSLPAQCAAQDIACICGDSTFITNISCCVSKSCAQSDQAAALSFALNLCQAGGVTLTNTAATCLSTSSSTSKTSTAPVPATTGSGTATISKTSTSGTAHATSTSTTAPSTSAVSTAAAPKITAMAGFFGAAAAAVALL